MTTVSIEDQLICRLEIDAILSPEAARAHWVDYQRHTFRPDLDIWKKLLFDPGPVSRIYARQFGDAPMVPLEKYPSFGCVRIVDGVRVYEGLSGRSIIIPQRENGGLFEIQMWLNCTQVAVQELPLAVLDIVLAAWRYQRGGNDWPRAREFLCERLDATLEIANSVDTKTWNRA